MTAIEAKLVAAVLRRQALLDAMAALRRQWQPCERTAFGFSDEEDRQPCWKGDRAGLEVEYYDGFRWVPFRRGSPEYTEHVAAHWCAACQANEPLVAEYYRLQRSKGGFASAVAQLARRIAVQRAAESRPPCGSCAGQSGTQGPDGAALCPHCSGTGRERGEERDV